MVCNAASKSCGLLYVRAVAIASVRALLMSEETRSQLRGRTKLPLHTLVLQIAVTFSCAQPHDFRNQPEHACCNKKNTLRLLVSFVQ